MRFKLNANWSIETEINQVTLIQTSIAQKGTFKGKMVDGNRWYWNNFTDALEKLIDMDIQSLEKVEEIEGRIANLKSEIKTMLKSLEEGSSGIPTRRQNPKTGKDKDTVSGKQVSCIKKAQ